MNNTSADPIEDLMTEIQAFGLACYTHAPGEEQIAMQNEIRAHLAALCPNLTAAAKRALAERKRHVEVEGWTPEHDDEHTDGGMVKAAACYALHTEPVGNVGDYLRFWPWSGEWWKPSADRRRNLDKAIALLLAEGERLDRADMASRHAAAAPWLA